MGLDVCGLRSRNLHIFVGPCSRIREEETGIPKAAVIAFWTIPVQWDDLGLSSAVQAFLRAMLGPTQCSESVHVHLDSVLFSRQSEKQHSSPTSLFWFC